MVMPLVAASALSIEVLCAAATQHASGNRTRFSMRGLEWCVLRDINRHDGGHSVIATCIIEQNQLSDRSAA